jgi:enoyl-CoA hydratase
MTDARLTMTAAGRNALGEALMASMIAELRAAAGRPLLLTGAGNTFSSGLNLKEVERLDVTGMRHFLGLLDELMDTLYTYPGPTVACVNGHAIAGGCVVALCCDYRVAIDHDDVRIGLNEVPLGLEFPPKILELVRRRVPPGYIDRVILEGALHGPRSARELGLVDEVAADVEPAALAALARLSAAPSAEYLAAKRALRVPLTLTPEQQRHFDDHVVPAWCKPAVKQRIRAALDRGRAPV